MLSKEEKRKYGEALRQQMKEKEDIKKNEARSRRAVNAPLHTQSDRGLVPDPSIYNERDYLQQKQEAQDYNPFGRAGGGAPNLKVANHIPATVEQSPSFTAAQQSQERPTANLYPASLLDNFPPSNRNSNQLGSTQLPAEVRQSPAGQHSAPYLGGHEALGYPQSIGDPLSPSIRGVDPYNSRYPQQQPSNSDPRFSQQEQAYLAAQYPPSPQRNQHPPSPQQPQRPQQTQPPQYPPQQTQPYQEYPQQTQPPQYPPQQTQPYQEYHQQTQLEYPQQQTYQQHQQHSRTKVQEYQEYQPAPMERQQPQALLQIEPPRRQRVKTLESDELHDVYKKGGRNLLRLENQTANQHLVKQKQKLEMQAFLKQQMDEADRRKQEEKNRIKNEELEEERRNKEYIQMQNQKLRQDEDQKNYEREKIVEENVRNLERKKAQEQLAKEKVERSRVEQNLKRELGVQNHREISHQQQLKIQRQLDDLPRHDSSSSVSEQSTSSPSYSKGFNTNISRDFVKKERQKEMDKGRNDKRLEMFTNEIQNMKGEIMNQGEVFQRELGKIKRQAENAQGEKRRAEEQVSKLKMELERKNKESDFRLFQALKRNNPYPQRNLPLEPQQRSYQHGVLNELQQHGVLNELQQHGVLNELQQHDYEDQKPYGIPSRPAVSAAHHPKAMAKNNQRVYEHPAEPERVKTQAKPVRGGKQWEKEFSLEQSVIGTLDADSKKVPINFRAGTKLTMSGINNLGNEGLSFGKSNAQSRVNNDEPKGSRASKRGDRDELDRLVDNRWEMSTVKDDITKEIEQLLKKKGSYNPQQGSFNPQQGSFNPQQGSFNPQQGSFNPQQGSFNPQQSQVSNAGNHLALSRGGIPYEGPALNSLNSNKASLVSEGTVDIDRIYGRNEARLRDLRALGVETINTNNDDDLNRLNVLLNHY